MKCRQPGCTGTIVDGYCDVCGLPPAPGTMPVGHGRPGGRPSTTATGPCSRPGCSGKIVDGYCDVCGLPPDDPGTGSADAGTPAVSSLTRASSHLGSTALGSARASSFGVPASPRRRKGRPGAGRIGAGLTYVPPAPAIDPSKAVLVSPVVPEDRRVCPKCGTKVGQTSAVGDGRSEGFCPNCGAPYSFTAKLAPGDLVAGQYRVEGALAHGGMGWIYLARDTNVSGRWVVLKGLLNTGDSDALAATISEQQFLARVEHPLIVEIYNFVTHADAGYIVMEYVGGRSLKQLLKQRMAASNGEPNPLPIDQALAFLIEILPAFSYLHDLGLLYCDFKPDNVIQVGDSLKLIDLGGVRHAGDDESAIYGTIGFQAPEVATAGASIAADIYTIGRTLMVLCADVPGYQSTYEFTIPPIEELPAFAEADAAYRLLLRCCAPDPNDRFASADELRTQMLGVLRETVAARTQGVASTAAGSALFEPPTATGDQFSWRQLPRLRPDGTDPQLAWLARINIDDPAERLTALNGAPAQSAEVLLARGHAALELGDRAALDRCVNQLLTADPWEWRAVWLAGLGALAACLYVGTVVIRQVLEPRIVGHNLGLYPLATMAAMYAGYRLLGFLGLLAGPVLLNVIVVVLEADDPVLVNVFRCRGMEQVMYYLLLVAERTQTREAEADFVFYGSPQVFLQLRRQLERYPGRYRFARRLGGEGNYSPALDFVAYYDWYNVLNAQL